MGDIYQDLANALGTRSKEFDSRNDAKVFRDEQTPNWAKLIRGINQKIVSSPISKRGNIIETLEEFLQWIIRNQADWFISEQVNNKYLVSGKIPLLPENMDQFYGHIDSNTPALIAALFSEIGLLLINEMYSRGDDQAVFNLDVFSVPPISIFASRYEAQKALIRSPLGAETTKLVQAAQDAKLRVDKSIETSEARLDEALGRINGGYEKLIADQTSRSSEWLEFIEKNKDEQKAAIATLIGKETLKSATKTWTNKVWMHRTAFFGGILILVSLAIGAFWYLSNHFDRVQDFIEDMKKPDGDIPYGIVLFCLVPVIAVGWLLRFIGKWIVNALALGADAQHRVALLETYFRLLSDPNNKMDPTERGIVLAALFRPVPGQESSDDVQPPSLLELIKGKSEK